MSEEKRKRLNSIGFTWKIREAHIIVDWEVRFQELVDYKRVYGNCNVPSRYKENRQLGKWVDKQRISYKKDKMSVEIRNKLVSIGFVWRLTEHAIVDWEVRFQQLVEYKRVHGKCNVPREYNANPQLGNWVSTQRTKKETMSEKRRKRLDSIGFVWRLKRGRPKQQPRVRPSTVEDPKKKKARLNEGAAQEGTGFGQKSWDSYFEQLCDFVRIYKHCNASAQHPELGRWTAEQRLMYERKQIGKETRPDLTDEREAKLMAVGFVFEIASPEGGGAHGNTYLSCIPDEAFS